MRNRERRNLDIADRESLASPDPLHMLDPGFSAGLLILVRIHPHDLKVGRLGEICRTIPFTRELRQATCVIGVLVRDQNGVDALRSSASKRFEPALHFFSAEAGVN